MAIGMLEVDVSQAISSVSIYDGAGAGNEIQAGGEGGDIGQAHVKGDNLGDAVDALDAAARKLNHFCMNIVAAHREAIAKLSVDIARKILSQKVQEKDYEICSIIEEALNNVPTKHDITVHLNPADLASVKSAGKGDVEGMFEGLKFAADPSIGCAECIVETPKGVIESLIDGHLEHVSRVLSNTV